MSSARWQPFCSSILVRKGYITILIRSLHTQYACNQFRYQPVYQQMSDITSQSNVSLTARFRPQQINYQNPA